MNAIQEIDHMVKQAQQEQIDPYKLRTRNAQKMTPQQLAPYYDALAKKYPNGVKFDPYDATTTSDYSKLPSWTKTLTEQGRTAGQGYMLHFGNGGYTRKAPGNAASVGPKSTQPTVSQPIVQPTVAQPATQPVLKPTTQPTVTQPKVKPPATQPVMKPTLAQPTRPGTGLTTERPTMAQPTRSGTRLTTERPTGLKGTNPTVARLKNYRDQLKRFTTPTVTDNGKGLRTERYSGKFIGGELVRPGQPLSARQQIADQVRRMTGN